MMKTRITRMRSLVSVALVMAPPWDQTPWRTHGPRSTAAASLSRDKQTHPLAPSLGLSGWTFCTGCSSNCESATETQRHKPRRVKCNFTSYCTSCPQTSEKWSVQDATETFQQQRVSRIVLFLSEGQRGSRWALWKKRYEDVSTVTLCEWQRTQVTGWSHCVVVHLF